MKVVISKIQTTKGETEDCLFFSGRKGQIYLIDDFITINVSKGNRKLSFLSFSFDIEYGIIVLTNHRPFNSVIVGFLAVVIGL